MKNLIAGFCILVSFILFVLANGRILGLVLPVVLFCMGFWLSGCLSFLLVFINDKFQHKKLPSYILFFLTTVCCFAVATQVKAIIIEKIPVENIFVPCRDIRSELSNTFDSYKASYYEGKGLGTRPCSMENRFVLILTGINEVETTNQEIHSRVEKLKIRKENLIKNEEKVNLRAENAETTKLILDIPDIYVPEIKLKNAYKDILVYNKALYNDINKKNCSPECEMTHIEQNSLSIVHEIDHIKKKQSSLIATLTAFERTFDELEKLQRMKETELVQRGF